MKKLVFFVSVTAMAFLLVVPCVRAENKVLFDYEESIEGWEIPEWALEKKDHVGQTVMRSEEYASHGNASLRLDTDFPGKAWSGAVVELVESFDWGPYSAVSCDIYLPPDAPTGLKAKMILTVGEEWKFTEMSRTVALVPGKWTNITADLLPGSRSWKMTDVDDNFRRDVRKIHIRIESNKAAYKGPIFIDNIVLIPKEG